MKVGTRAGRIGVSLLRLASYLLALAFLRFETLIIAQTAVDARERFVPSIEHAAMPWQPLVSWTPPALLTEATLA